MIPYETYAQTKFFDDYDRSSNVLLREIMRFWKYLVVFEVYGKMYVKMQKFAFAKNAITSEMKWNWSLLVPAVQQKHVN